jgi:hypothetical protein
MKTLNLPTLFILLGLSVQASADNTELARIVFTEGHSSPNCRTIEIKENDSGSTKRFRIAHVDGDDDIASIVLAALMAERDVKVWYTEGVTTGCGNEPKISYLRVY